MKHRNQDPMFDPDEIENQDPLGEQAFEEEGFEDAEDGGPMLSAPGLADDRINKTPGEKGQKVAGIPEEAQNQTTTPSGQRPDSKGVVIRERGGQSKGDPAVGGTRPK